MTQAFVGLGCNLGARQASLQAAVRALRALPHTTVTQVSSVYDTEPMGDPSHPRYLNAVVVLETGLSADQLLWNLQRIEHFLGRAEGSRSGPRTLDLDLLFFGRARIDRPNLTVPHPRLAERAFVLVPMVEVAPGWMDPRTGLTMSTLLGLLQNTDQVRRAGRFIG